MERLTEKHYLGTDHYMKCSGNCNVDMDCIDCPSFDRLVERLAAYEDTGYTPEEIAKIREESEAGCIRAVARMFGVDTKRLRELAAADRLGRVAVLPCNVGDTVYMTFGKKVEERRVIEFDVVACKSSGPVVHAALAADQQVTMSVRWDLVVDKTVFLTRKDAEAALKGEENGRG